MRNNALAAVLVASIAAAGAGLFAYRTMVAKDAVARAAGELIQLRLHDLSRGEQSLAHWHDKILIVNFWATWCEPCREEVPALLHIQSKYASKSVQVVGIAIDSADKVQQFAKDYQIHYPLFVGGMEIIELTRRLGNQPGGLPYTVIIDQTGRVAKTHLGRITKDQLESAIRFLTG